MNWADILEILLEAIAGCRATRGHDEIKQEIKEGGFMLAFRVRRALRKSGIHDRRELRNTSREVLAAASSASDQELTQMINQADEVARSLSIPSHTETTGAPAAGPMAMILIALGLLIGSASIAVADDGFALMGTSPAQTQALAYATLEIESPLDTEIYLLGRHMPRPSSSMHSAVRRFRVPLKQSGIDYNYAIEVRQGAKSISSKFKLRAGKLTRVRADFVLLMLSEDPHGLLRSSPAQTHGRYRYECKNGTCRRVFIPGK